MVKLKYTVITALFLLYVLSGCGNDQGAKQQNIAAETEKSSFAGNESHLLLKELEDNGDYVNSQFYPSLIKASAVKSELGMNNLVVDLRSDGEFESGHIEGSVNKQFSELPDYFRTGIKPSEFDKIVLVCDDGQLSSYATSLLRLMGYGNVFAMRWGMSAWNKSYATEGWLKGVSAKYENQLEVSVNEAPAATSMPALNTGLSTGREIADKRFISLFNEGANNIFISAGEVFGNPSGYFVINLDRKDKYENGHIPGAVRYKPESTLSFSDVMATIPSDKTVVVYCGTGHSAGFATAYLRLFGYNARILKYGNNSFMYDKMIKEKKTLSWLPFTTEESNDFRIVK